MRVTLIIAEEHIINKIAGPFAGGQDDPLPGDGGHHQGQTEKRSIEEEKCV